GRGGAVIGGALAASLARAEVEATVLDRFFPRVEAAARPRRGTELAPREWGLPFAEEPEITRHLAEFLARQRAAAGQADLPLARPDALLFNGGALEPEIVRARLCDVVASWHGGRRPAVLEGESLQLAVARGAAYFGLARRGLGVRIGGGAARTYYLGLGDGRALCLVPRGMEEGEQREITEPEFELLANRPVSFPLLTATDRSSERAGEIVAAGGLGALPPIRTVLRFGRQLVGTALPGLWDTLWPLEPARARSPAHEARWLNLAGFLLRPGFGDAGDELRVNRLWRVLGADLRHPRAVQCRAEWWNLWKRIAGGLA